MFRVFDLFLGSWSKKIVVSMEKFVRSDICLCFREIVIGNSV